MTESNEAALAIVISLVVMILFIGILFKGADKR